MAFEIKFVDDVQKRLLELNKDCIRRFRLEKYNIEAFVTKKVVSFFDSLILCKVEFLLPSFDCTGVSVIGNIKCIREDDGIKEICDKFTEMISRELSNPFGLGYIKTHQILLQPHEYYMKIKNEDAEIYILKALCIYENFNNYIINVFHNSFYGYSAEICFGKDVPFNELEKFIMGDVKCRIDDAIQSYEFLALLMSKGRFINVGE